MTNSMYLASAPQGEPFGRIFPPRLAWLKRARAEDAIDPDLPIIDAHHHLWDRPGNRYLLSDFVEDLSSGHQVTATVFADAGAMYRSFGPEDMRPVGETEFIAGVAAMSDSGQYGPARVCQGIVAHADLRSDNISGILDAHEAASGTRLRGIRQSGAWDPSPSILSPTSPGPHLYVDPRFIRGARQLTSRSLVLDVYVFHPQLDDVIALSDTLEELTIVVDHVGTPLGYGSYARRGDEVFSMWRRSMTALAARDNVVVKLGGLTSRLALFNSLELHAPLSSAELAGLWKPYLYSCIELFGPHRCMFESNFPVDKTGTSYFLLWNAFKRIAADASPDEKQALFSRTARRVYRL